MLEVIDIKKQFNRKLVLNGVSFKIHPGQVFALLGPNGAGKTTTTRIIMNILKPDSGSIFYNDQPRNKVSQKIFGYLPEERGLYQRATVLSMLIYFATLNNMSAHRAEIEAIRWLDRLGLVDYTKSRVNELSKGMQQKYNL